MKKYCEIDISEWKDLPEFFNMYLVNNKGEVYSKYWKRILNSNRRDKGGYCTIILCLENKKKRDRKIHRLVAKAFIHNPENKKTVNHKDGNKANNHVDNLEWATHAENLHHALKVLRINTKSEKKTKQSIKNGRIVAKPIIAFDTVNNKEILLPSIKRASEILLIDRKTIERRLRLNITTVCKGYYFKYHIPNTENQII